MPVYGIVRWAHLRNRFFLCALCPFAYTEVGEEREQDAVIALDLIG